jgi:hypothetical protein
MDHLRTWTDPDGHGFKLVMFDGNRTSYGKNVVDFKFFHNDELIFESWVGCSPMHAIDSDQATGAILAFCSLRPGDTDPEYFEDYSERQLEFCKEWGETLSLYVEELENPVRYFRHTESGDYLAIRPHLWRRDNDGQKVFDGRATAIAGLVTSVCSCTIGETYLEECEPVEKDAVPKAWLDAIGF